MRMWLVGIITGAALGSLALAEERAPVSPEILAVQDPQTPASQPAQPPQRAGSPKIAPGSVIPVQLTKTVDAKKVKTGDEVDAKVTQDMKTANGDLVMAKDTKVVGHVTEVQARTKEQKESQLAIAFDRTVLKDGSIANLPMSIQAVIAPQGQPNRDNGGDTGGATPAPSAQMPQSNGGGRSGGMGGGASQQPAPSSRPGGQMPSDTGGSDSHPPITMNTQGVVGMPGYSLSTSGGANQGSVLSSEKNNVKLESGTLMLLKVNP